MQFSFTCPLPSGFHARPASLLVQRAGRFAADCKLSNRRSGGHASLKSVLALLAVDVRHGDECQVDITGVDEAAACADLRGYIESELPQLEARQQDTGVKPQTPLPLSLARADVLAHNGLSLHPGIGEGCPVVIGNRQWPANAFHELEAATQDAAALMSAVKSTTAKLEATLAAAATPDEAAILKAHRVMVTDPALLQKILALIDQGSSATAAIAAAGQFFQQQLRDSRSQNIRERAADVLDVCFYLFEELNGPLPNDRAAALREPSIVLAETLTPQQLLSLDRRWLSGLVLESRATTSHVAILARSLAIPTLMGVTDATRELAQAEKLIVDGGRGIVLADSPAVEMFYRRERQVVARRRSRLAQSALQTAQTRDRHSLGIAANVMSAEEARQACALGAQGIGLFRTELLFLSRGELLSEEEQFLEYAAAARQPGGVTLRCLDVGADKPLPQLPLPAETNPFLGCRGVRVYRQYPELFRSQLRAILRASAVGPVRLLIPMVSCLEEVQWVAQELVQVKAELQAQQVKFDPALPVGVMLEVPAACFILEPLCAQVDFFSIGSNDLAQYFTAADRDNPRVSGLAEGLHPGFLRLLQQCVQQIHQAGKKVTLCGEIAAEARHLPLMVGLGVDDISVTPERIPMLKERIRGLSAADCKRLLEHAIHCSTATEVHNLLASEPAHAPSLPLLDPGLVLLDTADSTREEVLRSLSDALFVCGRSDAPDEIERALWAREATYPTDLGNGFAVPHCKTGAIEGDSIALLKPRQPLTWDASQSEPVRMVIMLAMREPQANERHMRVLSVIARKLMDEKFRQRLLSLGNAADMVQQLIFELETTTEVTV